MKSEAEYIAAEIMNMIERERRINKDDLVMAVAIAGAKYEKDLEADNPVVVTAAAFEYIEATHANQPFMYHGDPATNAAVGVKVQDGWIQSVSSSKTPSDILHTHTITSVVASSDTVASSEVRSARLVMRDGELGYTFGSGEWVKL